MVLKAVGKDPAEGKGEKGEDGGMSPWRGSGTWCGGVGSSQRWEQSLHHCGCLQRHQASKASVGEEPKKPLKLNKTKSKNLSPLSKSNSPTSNILIFILVFC